MSREIKFRIWRAPDEYSKTFWMESWDSLMNYSMSDIFQLDNPDDVLEQYTGLKDANGKDIYEGDIVHVVTEDGYERTGKVIFEEGCYWVDNGMDKYPVNRIGFERDTLEVLGNVHVNPNIIDFYDMKQL